MRGRRGEETILTNGEFIVPHLWYGIYVGGSPLWGVELMWLLQLQWSSVLQYLIPQVGQVVFPQVSVEGRVIHSDELGFLNCSDGPLCLPINYGETLQITWCPVDQLCWWMGDGALRYSQISHQKCYQIPQCILWTVHVVAFVIVDNSTFLAHVILVLRGHE